MATQQVFKIGQGDTGPPIQWICQDGNGGIVNVGGATVKFHLTDLVGNIVVDALGNVPNGGTDGVVEYLWKVADTSATGAYNAEFQVTFASGLIETFPVTPKILVQIFAQLAP